MPRPPRAPRAALSNSLVSSGMRVQATSGPATASPGWGQPWQHQAWHYFDTVGELRFAATWFSKVLSRARLYAAKRNGRDFKEEKAGDIFEIVSDFFHGAEGQAQALAAIGVHLFLVGECYVVGRKPRPARREKGDYIWEVVSIKEMQTTGGQWTINYGDGKPLVTLNGDEDIIRIWQPHPKQRILADSPVRAVLGTLAEIERINQHIWAQLVSRLASAGLLLLPQGMTFPSPPTSTLPEDATDADKVMAVLYEAFVTAVQNPGDASALAPIVMLVPDDFVDKANLLKFWTELDAQAIEMRKDAQRNLAIGLDLPMEIILGTGDANHWSMWQIDESSIKSHVEPVLELIVAALSVNYVAVASGDPKGAVRYDTSALRLRPNRSKEAIELYDRGELKAVSLLRETGFGPEDAPDAREKRLWTIAKIASLSSATPEMMAEALRALGIDLGSGADVESEVVKESRPNPSLLEHPTRDLPDTQDIPAAVDVGLMASASALADRALERAGNRMKTRYGIKPNGIPSADLYLHYPVKPADVEVLLEDAWACIPRILKTVPFDQQQAVQAGLDSYVRALLMGQVEQDEDLLRRHLTHTPVRQFT